MIPLRDLNPTRRPAVMTYTIIAMNILVFLWQVSLPAEELQTVLMDITVVPAQITADPWSLEAAYDVFRSAFLHGGWAHLIGNMLYLYLFGDNVEDWLGRAWFLTVYALGAVAAVAAQIMVNPDSQVPLVGASGAIAGILGAYLVLYPRVKVYGVIPLGYFLHQVKWPAWLVLGLWFLLQLFNGLVGLGVETTAGGGVAFFAHVGGFVVGAAVVGVLALLTDGPSAQERSNVLHERAENVHGRRWKK